jgi:S-DNA-T family DNA segregation ATPase FtsK/SpoIIIE
MVFETYLAPIIVFQKNTMKYLSQVFTLLSFIVFILFVVFVEETNNKKHVVMKEHIARGAREGALLSVVVLAVFVLMALLTFNNQDPGWSYTGSHQDVQNFGGLAGAWLADVLYGLWGKIAFIFPLLLIYRSWSLFKLRNNDINIHWPLVALKIGGLLVVMMSFAALYDLYTPPEDGFRSGGYLGELLADYTYTLLGFSGGSLVLLALTLFGLTLFADISWLNLMDWLGSKGFAFAGKISRWGVRIKNKFQRLFEKRTIKVDNNDHVMAPVVKKQRMEPVLLTQQVSPKKTSSVAETAKNKTASVIKASTDKVADAVTKTLSILPFEKKSSGAPSVRAQQELQSGLFEDISPLPKISLLTPASDTALPSYSDEVLENLSRLLEQKLLDFGVKIEVVAVNPGPVITRFEIETAPGVKASKISNLAKDLARSLAMSSVRVVEVIAGKSVMGIEIPNENRQMVRLAEVLSSPEYDNFDSPVALALGHDIAGDPVITDLAKMPHLLVAGTTGSGKSVGVNAMLLSILFKSTPKEVRLIMVDPKMLELSIYDGIPHLLTPVVTDMKDAANALRWCVAEMERRYKLLSAVGVRNLAGYNRKVREAIDAGEPLLDPLWTIDETGLDPTTTAPELEHLPIIVVVVDEFADMMMIVGKKVEELIARIAQKARAAGIHLILATQRPSVDVITGLIKANVPTRIAFQVSSKIDSRTILDQGGAEQLLGHGDMLYMPPGTSLPVRVHGAFVDDDEVHRVVADWKTRGKPVFIEDILASESEGTTSIDPDGEDSDPLYDQAVEFVTSSRKASISAVQRKLRVGYNRAARLVEIMEGAGVVSEAGHNGSREVLAPPPPSRD